MDYEKKYKEALRKATKIHRDDNEEIKHYMEVLFPELAESEDEKIRELKMIEQKSQTLWHPADGDYLPEIDRSVIVLTQKYPLEGSEYAVSFAHRPEEAFIQYGKGGWSQPDVKWWLDCDLPINKQENGSKKM